MLLMDAVDCRHLFDGCHCPISGQITNTSSYQAEQSTPLPVVFLLSPYHESRHRENSNEDWADTAGHQTRYAGGILYTASGYTGIHHYSATAAAINRLLSRPRGTSRGEYSVLPSRLPLTTLIEWHRVGHTAWAHTCTDRPISPMDWCFVVTT